MISHDYRVKHFFRENRMYLLRPSLKCLNMFSLQTLLTDIHDQEENVDTALIGGREFLQATRASLSPDLRLNLESKMTSLELRWAKLQSECEGRNQKLDMIHDMLMSFERTLNPFMVSQSSSTVFNCLMCS